MKTKVRSTSLMAYRDLKKKGLAPSQKTLLQALQQIEPACDRDLARHLGWEVTQVNGRRNELVALGEIVECDEKRISKYTGKLVTFWKLSNKQIDLFTAEPFVKEFGDSY